MNQERIGRGEPRLHRTGQGEDGRQSRLGKPKTTQGEEGQGVLGRAGKGRVE